MGDTIETANAFGYDQDFYAWTQTQAAALRAAALGGANLPVDWENVAEEIESLGKSQASTLRSRLRTIIEHLLKLEFSPARNPAFGWQDTVERSRIDFDDDIKDSPSLRQRIPEWVEREQRAAARLVLFNLRQHGEWTPDVGARMLGRHYTDAEVLGDWWPDIISRSDAGA